MCVCMISVLRKLCLLACLRTFSTKLYLVYIAKLINSLQFASKRLPNHTASLSSVPGKLSRKQRQPNHYGIFILTKILNYTGIIHLLHNHTSLHHPPNTPTYIQLITFVYSPTHRERAEPCIYPVAITNYREKQQHQRSCSPLCSHSL